MSNNWNLERLERQAISNQNFDDYVLDDSFKFCYPNNDILKEIFDLYENEIMRKSSITRYTDRYIIQCQSYTILQENSFIKNDFLLLYFILIYLINILDITKQMF